MNQHPNRIPNDEVSNCKTWKIPEIDGGNILPSAEKEERERREREARARGEVIGEDVETDQFGGPITAAELEKITEQAHQEGYSRGFEQGYAEGIKTGSVEGENKAYGETREQLENNLASLKLLIDGLTDPFEQHTNQLQDFLLTTLMSLVKSVVKRELSIQPQEIESVIELALAVLPKNAREVAIQLHPDDITMLRESFPHKTEAWNLQADPDLSRGGVVVHSKDSLVDFSIEQQLKQLHDKLLRGELTDHPHESNSGGGDQNNKDENNLDAQD